MNKTAEDVNIRISKDARKRLKHAAIEKGLSLKAFLSELARKV